MQRFSSRACHGQMLRKFKLELAQKRAASQSRLAKPGDRREVMHCMKEMSMQSCGVSTELSFVRVLAWIFAEYPCFSQTMLTFGPQVMQSTVATWINVVVEVTEHSGTTDDQISMQSVFSVFMEPPLHQSHAGLKGCMCIVCL